MAAPKAKLAVMMQLGKICLAGGMHTLCVRAAEKTDPQSNERREIGRAPQPEKAAAPPSVVASGCRRDPVDAGSV